MKPASTEWREIIAPDEPQRFKLYTQQLTQLQSKLSKKFGIGRALHRKQVLAIRAEFEVLPQLPSFASQGLFKKPGVYQALVRISNGSMNIQPDRMPDIRGFSFKVLGVEGTSALGGAAKAQDFLLINREFFGLKNSDEFIGLVMAATEGGGALIAHFFKRYGFFKGLARLKSALAGMRRPFTGFATEMFYSCVPIACGPYAARVRMLPASRKPKPGAEQDWAADLQERLAQDTLSFDIQLQFFVDETTTPIEDGTVNWEESEAPYVTVARLRLPRQSFTSDADRAFQESVARNTFDPWCALAEHRPLGDIMRARKDTYFGSQNNRKS
ncbi:MAG TPA: hypothetical protein VE954_07430 [Oligoflexus sp.]|uniref:hypothetical protein n=1 Tax=Oligoflexus sp. TaxID=1971216 RepID=UPI002D528419|nr:hypothetical protein [Oligoflexus sp.]HYX32930.1 hypothetical protein [Oligoflexus sp.]